MPCGYVWHESSVCVLSTSLKCPGGWRMPAGACSAMHVSAYSQAHQTKLIKYFRLHFGGRIYIKIEKWYLWAMTNIV